MATSMRSLVAGFGRLGLVSRTLPNITSGHQSFIKMCYSSMLSHKGVPHAKQHVLPIVTGCRNISSLLQCQKQFTYSTQNELLKNTSSIGVQPCRTKIYISRRKGKPKTVRSVIKRFFRLDSGLWIRPRAGRNKKLWKKGKDRKYRLRQHVFCNKQQCKLLDKMVGKYYKEKKYYVNDPYEPYQKRTGLPYHYYEPPKFLP